MSDPANLDSTPRPEPGRLSPVDILRTFRPSQWTKNVVVMAAFFFAFWDRAQIHRLGWKDFADVLLATVLFCVVSSGIYVLNDIVDIQADRHHPVKRNRPIAAGRVPIPAAWAVAILLLGIGSFASWMLLPGFDVVVGSYAAIQIAYTFALKRIAFIDILVIAAGFVLRAIAGAVVINVEISPWLLLCTFLLALFLALCKRRHEKILVPGMEANHRPSLEQYDRHLLDLMIAIVSSATIVAYAMYTLSPETTKKFGTTALGFTIPFVIFGVFRYLDLVYRHQKGGRPEKIFLTDLPILVNIALYGAALVVIFLLSDSQTML